MVLPRRSHITAAQLSAKKDAVEKSKSDSQYIACKEASNNITRWKEIIEENYPTITPVKKSLLAKIENISNQLENLYFQGHMMVYEKIDSDLRFVKGVCETLALMNESHNGTRNSYSDVSVNDIQTKFNETLPDKKDRLLVAVALEESKERFATEILFTGSEKQLFAKVLNEVNSKKTTPSQYKDGFEHLYEKVVENREQLNELHDSISAKPYTDSPSTSWSQIKSNPQEYVSNKTQYWKDTIIKSFPDERDQKYLLNQISKIEQECQTDQKSVDLPYDIHSMQSYCDLLNAPKTKSFDEMMNVLFTFYFNHGEPHSFYDKEVQMLLNTENAELFAIGLVYEDESFRQLEGSDASRPANVYAPHSRVLNQMRENLKKSKQPSEKPLLGDDLSALFSSGSEKGLSTTEKAKD